MSRRLVCLVCAGLFGAIEGCGPTLPPLYPVKGRVELETGDVADLADSTVEVALNKEPNVRASASIQQDGTFELESLISGVIAKGAQPGEYNARIILSDDGDRADKQKRRALVPARYLQMSTSGWMFEVPPLSEVVLRIAKK
jgi:hypothetical protein